MVGCGDELAVFSEETSGFQGSHAFLFIQEAEEGRGWGCEDFVSHGYCVMVDNVSLGNLAGQKVRRRMVLLCILT